jgi:hypothetical protein
VLIRFDAAPDRARLTAATRQASRSALLILRVAGVVFGVLAVVQLAVLGDVVTAAVFAVACVALVWLLPALLVRRAVGKSWQLLGVPSSWELRDDGVRHATALGETLIRWAAVTGVRQLPDQLVLRLGNGQFVPMPIGALTPGERDELFALLRERGLLPRPA